MRRLALALFALLLVEPLLTLVLLLNHRRGLEPPPQPLLAVALAAGGVERVRFPTEDGLSLRGELLGDAGERPVVVLGHGYRHTRRQGDPLAARLLDEGYAVLLFDFRGCGESDGLFTTAGALEGRDVRAALGFLEEVRGLPSSRIAYVGYSMGAAAGLLAADALARLGAVVLVAPYASLEETFEARTRRFLHLPLRPWFSPVLALFGLAVGVEPGRVRPLDHASSLSPAPVLYVGARGDWRAPAEDLARMAAATRPPRRIVVLPGGGHYWLARYERPVADAIVRFLSEKLPPARR